MARLSGATSLARVTAPRPPLPKALVAGAVVVVLGLVSWALYGLAAGRENTAYHANAAPPYAVRLSGGHAYWLAVPGGVGRLRQAGVDPSRLACTATQAGHAATTLGLTPVVQKYADDTKFLDRVASFVAARSGRFHVACNGVGGVYVANPAGGAFDWSGLWLVLASVALAVGLPLVLSGLRRLGPRAAAEAAAPEDPGPTARGDHPSIA